MVTRLWERREQLLALRLYCLLPFGLLHKKNKEVIAVADAINRTPSAVAMKSCNFASLDPDIEQKGLSNASRSDRELWAEFNENSEKLSTDAEEVFHKLTVSNQNVFQKELPIIHEGPTESIREVRVRRVQGFFRRSVLVSYDNKCAISGLKMPELIIASHIIPWSVDENRRADPTNGIALNALYDVAFDKGLMTFDEELRVLLSKQLLDKVSINNESRYLFDIEGRMLNLPNRFYPDMDAIKYHRENIFYDSESVSSLM